MLKKENRLQKEKDFGKVFKGSRPIHTQNLAFRVTKRMSKSPTSARASAETGEIRNPKPNEARFGFVISNKISKLATRRNALKRQLRAIIEQEMPNVKAGYDVVIMVKLDFKYPYKQDEIREQVREGFGKAGIQISN